MLCRFLSQVTTIGWKQDLAIGPIAPSEPEHGSPGSLSELLTYWLSGGEGNAL